MKCEPSTIELETVNNRINSGDLNLQPNFQRGEVWGLQKKKKLIDSILRGWKIPPIHVIEGKGAIDEVLDGQQRLVAIRDFLKGEFSVDGNITPIDDRIRSYHGLFYENLPDDIQRTFRKYGIIIIRLTEFKPEEPAELFYRLNQPVSLTSAEQRNAFIGETRDQIKHLVNVFEGLGANKDIIGFSNSRLAYDEVISKFCYSVELGTLQHKITAAEISEKYRKDYTFPSDCIFIAETVIHKFMECVNSSYNMGTGKVVFNKATLFSWFVFIKKHEDLSRGNLVQIINVFENCREFLKGKTQTTLFNNSWRFTELRNEYPFLEIMLNTFNQRASMGSTDALSIIYRDIILQLFYDIIFNPNTPLLELTIKGFKNQQNFLAVLDKINSKYNWGGTF